MSRRIAVIAGTLGAALAILAERGIAVSTADEVVVARDADGLAALARAWRDPFPLLNYGPEPVSAEVSWDSEPCPPFLQRAAHDHHALRPRQAPDSYG